MFGCSLQFRISPGQHPFEDLTFIYLSIFVIFVCRHLAVFVSVYLCRRVDGDTAADFSRWGRVLIPFFTQCGFGFSYPAVS